MNAENEDAFRQEGKIIVLNDFIWNARTSFTISSDHVRKDFSLGDDFQRRKTLFFFIKMIRRSSWLWWKSGKCVWLVVRKFNWERKILNSNDKYWFYCYVCEQAKKLSKCILFFGKGASLNLHEHTFYTNVRNILLKNLCEEVAYGLIAFTTGD